MAPILSPPAGAARAADEDAEMSSARPVQDGAFATRARGKYIDRYIDRRRFAPHGWKMDHLARTCLPLWLLTCGACIITSSDDTDTDAAGGTATGDAATDDGATSSPATTAATTMSADESDGSAGADAGDTTGGGPSANERCTPFCDELVATNCDNGLTTEGCLFWCESLTSAEACETTAHTYFDCVEGETLMCNGAGDAVAPACALDYLVAIECAVTENPNPAIVEPCMEHCGLIQDAACPNNGDLDQCMTNCLWSGNTGLGCDGEWTTYVECFNQSNVSCLFGFAVGEGCGPDYQAYLTCLNDPA